MEQNSNIVPKNEELDEAIYDKEKIKNLIYNIRGKQVMLDSDVAMLYHYETKNINKSMKRNIERFPDDFCFRLTENEIDSLRFQTGTLNKNGRGQHSKYLPYVYTEQGISMLAGILKNDIAVKVSINIIRAFIEMRKFIANNGQLFSRLTNIEYKLLEHDKKFDEVFNELQKNEENKFQQQIFYDGQIYDAYSLMVDIIKSAKNKIVIIDNYIDDSILKMLSKKEDNVEVVILTSPNTKISKLDITKFNKQYPTLKMATTNNFHDRFILIDNTILYHCGASLKDLGKKCFAINKIEDAKFIEFVEHII